MMIKRVDLQFLVKFRATFFLDNVNPREIREKSIVICGQLKKNKITASEPWEFDKMDSSMQKFRGKIITPNMCVVVLKFHYEKWQEGAIDFKAFLVLVIFRKFIWSKAHFAQSKTFEAETLSEETFAVVWRVKATRGISELALKKRRKTKTLLNILIK